MGTKGAGTSGPYCDVARTRAKRLAVLTTESVMITRSKVMSMEVTSSKAETLTA